MLRFLADPMSRDATTSRGASGAPPPAGQPIPALDGLRGVAILSVLLFHCAWFAIFNDRATVSRLGAASGVMKVLLCGWSGVDLFFVLSGYLITSNLLAAKGRDGFFRVFYWRRFLRIFPAYYLTLFVMEVVIGRIPELEEGTSPSWRVWVWTYLTNWLVGTQGWEALPRPITHFWTLAVEEQFYLFWPLLIFLLSRRASVVACLLSIGGSLAFRIFLVSQHAMDKADVLTAARMDSLAVGALLALVAQGSASFHSWRRAFQLGAVVAGLAVAGLFLYRGSLSLSDPLVVTVGFTAIALGSCAVLALCLMPEGGFLARLMSFGPLRSLGRYSYGLYLVHHPVIFFCYGLELTPTISASVGGEASPLLSVLIADFIFPIVVSIAFAILSWNLFEKQLLRFKDRVGYTPLPAPEVAGS